MEREMTATDYQLPPLALFDEYVPEDEITGRVEAIRNVLESGKVRVKDINVSLTFNCTTNPQP